MPHPSFSSLYNSSAVINGIHFWLQLTLYTTVSQSDMPHSVLHSNSIVLIHSFSIPMQVSFLYPWIDWIYKLLLFMLGFIVKLFVLVRKVRDVWEWLNCMQEGGAVMSRCGFRSVRCLEVKIRCTNALGPCSVDLQ